MVSQKVLDKAGVLIEALPYIQRFYGNIIVIKYGGAAMKNKDLQRHVIQDVVLLKTVGFRPIVVHGGGSEISKWAEKTGIEQHFHNGLRITDESTLEIAKMVLAKVNSELVAMAERMGAHAVGISGIDGCLMTAHKQMPDGADIGYVGEITNVNTRIIRDMLENDFIPFVYPIAADEDGQAYNINADHAASAIAEAMRADKLAFLSDIAGVLEDVDDPESVIAEIYADDAEKLIQDGTISGGMIPKIQNCVDAVRGGVRRVHIMDGRLPHSLLLEFFTDKGVGTAVMAPREERFYKD